MFFFFLSFPFRLPGVDDKMKWHCNWISVFWITLTDRSLQDFWSYIGGTEIHLNQIKAELLCFKINRPGCIHQTYVRFLYAVFRPPQKYVFVFQQLAFCTKIMRTERRFFAVAFRKMVWKMSKYNKSSPFHYFKSITGKGLWITPRDRDFKL